MSEYEDDLEGLEEGDDELREEIDHLREQIEDRFAAEDEVRAINAQIQGFSRQHGLRLSPADIQSIGQLVDEDGMTVEDAYAELEGEDFSDAFADTVERVERQQGRGLLDTEVEALLEEAWQQDDPAHVDERKILDLDRARDRADYLDQALSDRREPPEQIAPLSDDADARQREQYYEARAAGAEVSDAEEPE